MATPDPTITRTNLETAAKLIEDQLIIPRQTWGRPITIEETAASESVTFLRKLARDFRG